jgi:hypothetical protein
MKLISRFWPKRERIKPCFTNEICKDCSNDCPYQPQRYSRRATLVRSLIWKFKQGDQE